MAHLAGSRIPPTGGVLTLAACDPGGAIVTPLMTTVLRPGRGYAGMADTEIRGLLDGGVKFERNVATQYHVRIGCEASGPVGGRYEVMRVLQRWDITSLPPHARVHAARLILRQEDITGFPHRRPLRWPVGYLLFDVRKPWGPGRGGMERNNVSPPEPGDAWWLEARAGEVPWHVPGCGFGSDADPRADRGGEPIAAGVVRSPLDDLVFTGERLARHIERTLAERRPLDLLLSATAVDEALPGSVKAFYSAEYGDGGNPERRPRLELDWTARAAWVEQRPFVLEPGGSAVVRPASPLERQAGGAGGGGAGREQGEGTLAASLRIEDAGPGAIPPEMLGGQGSELVITTAVQPVPAGDPVPIRILETWTPSVPRPEDLEVRFRFTAPSGRTLDRRARHTGEHIYVCEVTPDEMGVWSYSWTTSPDRRFPPHQGSGWLTVIRRTDGGHLQALRSFAEKALAEAAGKDRRLVGRQRSCFRLTALGREVNEYSRTDGAPASPGDASAVRELLEAIGRALEAARG